MKKFFLLCLICFLGSTGFANRQISSEEVKTLKQSEPELWYVDSLPTYIAKKVDSSAKKSEKLKRDENARNEKEVDIKFWGKVFDFFKWSLILAVLAGIFYLIVKGDFKYSFRPRPNPELPETILESTQIETVEQLQTIGFEDQISRAEQNENYRLAIRLYYLWVLKQLIAASLVTFNINKTNQDYRTEIKGSIHFSDFCTCSDYYNYVWFGEFQINQGNYQKIVVKFKTLISQLG